MAKKKKITVSMAPKGPVVIRPWVTHYITGKRIYPVKAKAFAFIPKKPKKK
jgi:hypothetical protein